MIWITLLLLSLVVILLKGNEMFIQMLKNQRVTFVSSEEQAMQYSPFKKWLNPVSGCYVVTDHSTGNPCAAGLTEEEATACVMFKANEHIYRGLQK